MLRAACNYFFLGPAPVPQPAILRFNELDWHFSDWEGSFDAATDAATQQSPRSRGS